MTTESSPRQAWLFTPWLEVRPGLVPSCLSPAMSLGSSGQQMASGALRASLPASPGALRPPALGPGPITYDLCDLVQASCSH